MGKTRVERHVRNGNIVEPHERTVGGGKRPSATSAKAQAAATKQALENAEAEATDSTQEPLQPEKINSHELVEGHRIRVGYFPYSEIAEVSHVGTNGSGDVRIHFKDKIEYPMPREEGVFNPVEVYPEGYSDPVTPYVSESGITVEVPQLCVERMTDLENQLRSEQAAAEDIDAMMLQIVNGGLNAVASMGYSRYYDGIHNNPIDGTVGVPSYEWTTEQYQASEERDTKFRHLTDAWKMHGNQVAFMARRAERRAEQAQSESAA